MLPWGDSWEPPATSLGQRMLKWKVDPRFLPSEVAHMVPPMASTSFLQIERPSPDPPCFRVREESTCVNVFWFEPKSCAGCAKECCVGFMSGAEIPVLPGAQGVYLDRDCGQYWECAVSDCGVRDLVSGFGNPLTSSVCIECSGLGGTICKKP